MVEQMHDEGAEEGIAGEGTMVTAVCWIPRGHARALLQEADPEQDEKNIMAHSRMQKKLAGKEEIGAKDIGHVAATLAGNLEGMADGEDSDELDDAPIFTPELARLKAKEKGLPVPDTAKGDEGEDEEMGDDDDAEDDEDGNARDAYPDEFSDSEEEKEDFTIRKTDSLIVAATAESDHSNLEVYIYEHEKGNLYVHHEVILGAYPLCIERLPKWQGAKANMMAVGTFLPEIEIWNLDSESCDPTAILGSMELSEQAKNTVPSVTSKYKKNAAPTMPFSEHTHTDSVMSLSLNPYQAEYLASGSADHTVRIWDLDEGVCKATYRDAHSDKVQVVRWNSQNEQVLLTGGYDGRLNVMDVRDSATNMSATLSKSLYKDIESAQWHPSLEHNFVVTTESGHMVGYDTRRMAKPLFSVKAHKKACSNAAFSPHIPSMLVSVGTDKLCKVWDITSGAAADGTFAPACITEKDLKQGDLFSVQMYSDIPWVLAAGGQKGELAIWDTEEDKNVVKHFKDQLPKKAKFAKKAVDKGMDDDAMVEDGPDSSGFEDVDSDEDDEQEPTQEEPKKKTKSKK